MSSVLVTCGVCGAAVRFPGGQPAPASVICEKPECQAEAMRKEAVNTPPEKPKQKAAKK